MNTFTWESCENQNTATRGQTAPSLITPTVPLCSDLTNNALEFWLLKQVLGLLS